MGKKYKEYEDPNYNFHFYLKGEEGKMLKEHLKKLKLYKNMEYSEWLREACLEKFMKEKK